MNISSVNSDVSVLRHAHLAKKIIIVDGLAGCGKTMLSPIVSSYKGVEKLCFAYELEYACALQFLGKLERTGASVYINLFVDQLIYNLMMSREVNFRPSDLSSVFNDPRPLRYFRRLFRKGDALVPELIEREKPILHLTTHHMLSFSDPIFSALGDRLTFIELVRHPLYMIKQHIINMETICLDSRDLNVYISKNGSVMPYYCRDWAEKFLESSPADRAIYYFEWFFSQTEKKRAAYSKQSPRRLLTIPFEQLVLTPARWVNELTSAIGSPETSKTAKELRKQRIPRKMVADGIPLKIYQRFGWEPAKSGSEREELNRRLEFVRERASSKAFSILEKISSDYERQFPFF